MNVEMTNVFLGVGLRSNISIVLRVQLHPLHSMIMPQISTKQRVGRKGNENGQNCCCLCGLGVVISDPLQ